MHRTAPVRSWWLTMIPWVMRLEEELTSFSPLLRHQTFSQNYVIDILHSTSSPRFTRLSVFVNPHKKNMICAAKRSQLRNGLSSAIRPLFVWFFGNSKTSTLPFHLSHRHFHTIAVHVSTRKWSLRNHFHSCTCVGHRILEYWLSYSIQYRISTWFYENQDLWWNRQECNGVCYGTFPLTTCRSRLTIPAISANQNWKGVCNILCQKTIIESYDRSRPFSFLLFQLFNSMLSTNKKTVDTSSLVGFFGFILTLGVSASKSSSSSSFPISTSARDVPNLLDVITNGYCISVQRFRRTYERTALPSPFSDFWEIFGRQWSTSFTLLISVDFTSRLK